MLKNYTRISRGRMKDLDPSYITGDYINYFSADTYAGMDGKKSGNNVVLYMKYYIRVYNSSSLTCSFNTVAKAQARYKMSGSFSGNVYSTASVFKYDTYVSPGSSPSKKFYPATSSGYNMTSMTTRITTITEINGDGYGWSNPRYLRSTSGRAVSHTIAPPTYSAKITSSGVNSLVINISVSKDNWGLWRYKIYNVTTGSYVSSSKYSAGNITVSNLSPYTNYTFRIEPWWAGQNFSAGSSNYLSISGRTLGTPPTVSIGSASSITHNSFYVSCTYNVYEMQLSYLTWEISGTFSDGVSRTLSFNSSNSTQFFQNINNYYIRNNSSYSIRVKATNNYGYSSSWSSYCYVNTLPLPPSISSIGVSDLSINSARLTVNYQIYCNLSSIKIEYKESSSSTYQTLSNGSSNTYYLNGVLFPGTTYDVRATVTDQYNRSITTTGSFTTLVDPPRILSLQVTNIDYYDCSVICSYYVATNIKSFTYKVLTYDGEVEKSGNASDNFNISELKPYTNYTLEVTITDKYDYSDTRSVQFSTLDDRAANLVSTDGVSKHHMYIIYPDGDELLILPRWCNKIE